MTRIAFIFLVLINSFGAFAAERLETADFRTVVDRISELTHKYDPSEILLAADIDSTLLVMNQDFGSDYWYYWQEQNILKDPQFKDRAADSVPELLSLATKIMSVSSMHVTQPELPQLLSDIQKMGVNTVVVTSRSPDKRDATERELLKNGYHFELAAPPSWGGTSSYFIPFDPHHAELSGISVDEIEKYRLFSTVRVASYMNGIYMSSGQHKGFAMRSMLKKLNKTYKSIVFIDDQESNCQAVAEAFKNIPIELIVVRFSRLDDLVESFRKKDKSEVISNVRMFQNTLNSLFDQNPSSH